MGNYPHITKPRFVFTQPRPGIAAQPRTRKPLNRGLRISPACQKLAFGIRVLPLIILLIKFHNEKNEYSLHQLASCFKSLFSLTCMCYTFYIVKEGW
jgi:hypothetical protein